MTLLFLTPWKPQAADGFFQLRHEPVFGVKVVYGFKVRHLRPGGDQIRPRELAHISFKTLFAVLRLPV